MLPFLQIDDNLDTLLDDDDDFLSPKAGKIQKSKQSSRGGLLSPFSSTNNASPNVSNTDFKNDFTYQAPKKNQGQSSGLINHFNCTEVEKS